MPPFYEGLYYMGDMDVLADVDQPPFVTEHPRTCTVEGHVLAYGDDETAGISDRMESASRHGAEVPKARSHRSQ